MAHPFFDIPAFPFNRPDAKELLRVLGILYPNVAAIQAVFENLGGDWITINALQPPALVWREVLRELCRNGQLKELCDQVLGRPNTQAGLLAIVQAVLEATYAPPPKPVLSDKLFILDRSQIHEKLALLADDSAPEKVILIRGGKASGKSHCHHLLKEKAKQAGADFKYLYAGLVSKDVEIVDQLFSHFNRSGEIPPMESTPDAWYKKVALKLKEIAATEGKPLWIAIDNLGLGSGELPEAARQFINQFALNMGDETFRQWFRLMLINYPDGTPTEWIQDFWTDTDDPIDEKDIQPQHVADCLLAWTNAQNRIIPPDDLMTHANNLISAVDTFQPALGEIPKPRLKRIHEELARIIKDLKAQTL